MERIDRTPAWMESAACKGHATNIWYPVVGVPTTTAKRICAACPVKAPCHLHAVDTAEIRGIWGGTSAEERRHARSLRVM